MMVRQCDDKITRGVRTVAVIGEKVINKGCQYCCGASCTGKCVEEERMNTLSLKSLKCLYLSYFSRFALKSPSKTSVLFSNESFSNNFGR